MDLLHLLLLELDSFQEVSVRLEEGGMDMVAAVAAALADLSLAPYLMVALEDLADTEIMMVVPSQAHPAL